jgi:hypothetical protein
MNLIFVLLLLAALYVAMAFYDRTRRRNTGHPWAHSTWRRDLTAHEIKMYREMHAHWRREARKTYRRINYDKKISYGNTNQK